MRIFIYVIACFLLIACKKELLSAQEVTFVQAIEGTKDSIIIIDSMFSYEYRMRPEMELEKKIGNASKIYIKKGDQLEHIYTALGGINEIISIYYGYNSKVRFRFSIIFKGGRLLSFTSIDRFPDQPDQHYPYELKEGQWLPTTIDNTPYFRELHDHPTKYQIDSIEWYNAKSFKIYYKPEMQRVGSQLNSLTGKYEPTYRQINEAPLPRVFVEVDGQIEWLKDYKRGFSKTPNLFDNSTMPLILKK